MQRLVLLALLVAACGGGDQASADVRRQADELCGAANQRLEAVEWPADDQLTVRSAAPAISETLAVHRDLLDALATLDGLDKLVGAGGPVVETLDRLRQASSNGDDAAFDAALAALVAETEDAADASERLGLATCYAPAEESG